MSVRSRTAGKALLASGGAVALAAGLLGPAAVASADDPAETEGTVKVAAAGGTRHKPRVDCNFDVLLYRFAAGDTGSFAFYAKRPSGSGQLLLEEADKPLTGNPDPARSTYTATDLGLTGSNPDVREHRRHGYHVKLVVSPGTGGTTGKVFWLKACESPTP